MRKLYASTAVVLALAGCHSKNAPESADTKDSHFITARVPLPGNGRGDYVTVDPDARRLYVTHSAALHILDLDTLNPIAEVGGLKAAHGTAIDEATGHGFVTDGDQNAVVMFDPKNGKTIKLITAGTKPDAIISDPASHMILAFNGDSRDVSVIDPAKATVVATIKLPNGPEFAVADGKGKVWVNLEEGNDIAEIDTKAMKVSKMIPLTGCDGPAPLAFDAVNRVLFSGCGNHVMTVTDADTGAVLATVPVGANPDGIVYDPGRKRVVVANRDATWTIVSQKGKSRYSVDQTLKIDEYAKTVGLDPKTHRIFSSTADLIWPTPTLGKKSLPNAKPGSFRLLIVSERK
jgi:DNA-binding beta-propeller fold protein YncE